MTALRVFLARFANAYRALAGSRLGDDETRDELATHLEMHIAENLRRGMSLEDARRDAMRVAGGLTVAAEAVRERRGLPVFENLASDLRYAVRALRAKPGYTAAVVLTLALGIGANSAMFTIVNAVVLRPLPYPDPNRIVSVSMSIKGTDHEVVPDRDYLAWTASARTLTLAAYAPWPTVIGTPNGPTEARGAFVTPEYFDVFSFRPLLGRVFDASERGGTPARVVVLSEQFWRERFGGDSAIIGRSISIDGKPETVIGVVPTTLTTPRRTQFWVPYDMEPSAPGSTFYYFVVGRLRAGFTLDAAHAELATITQRAAATRSKDERDVAPVLMTLHERTYGDRREPLLLLFSAVGVLLLIACANLANLTLARTTSRRREVAVRRALGAGRWRLVSAMLCESLLLSVGGAVLGLVFATASVGYVVRLSPASVGNMDSIGLDGHALVFTAVVALAAGLAFGFAPAVAAARGDLQQALSASGPRSAGSLAQQFVRRTLVVGQLATALVLLTGAGLVARTFWNVAAIDPGFRPADLVALSFHIPSSRLDTGAAPAYFGDLLTRLRATPGVASAVLADAAPLSGMRMSVSTTDSAGNESPRIDLLGVGPDYFRTIGAVLPEGRAIDASDKAGGDPVMVVNATLARYLFPAGHAVGQRARLYGKNPTLIIGVVRDVLQRELEGIPAPTMYLPLSQIGMRVNESIIIRLDASVDRATTGITQAVRSFDPTLPAPRFRQLPTVLAEAVAPRQFTFLLLGVFATIAAVLAAVGLYGVLAHLVADRTREIGIRVALGADARRVMRLVLGQGLALALLGVVLGMVASTFAVRAVRSLVSGVSVYDPWTFAAVATLLVAVSALASWLPARRASRVDPVIALRAE